MIIRDIWIYVLCALPCVVAYGFRWLTVSGSIAAFIMASIFINAGLASFFLPMLLLVGGSLLSRLNKNEQEKGGRNARQVLANGLIGSICLVCFIANPGTHDGETAFAAYLLSFAISISDTFSSEIGKYIKGPTVDIITRAPVVSGLSGGVSRGGTLGGLGGSVLSAMVAMMFTHISLGLAALLVLLSFTGMLLDSVLGSILQVKYMDENGTITEQRPRHFKIYKGIPYFNNDVVNLVSNLLVVILFLLLY